MGRRCICTLVASIYNTMPLGSISQIVHLNYYYTLTYSPLSFSVCLAGYSQAKAFLEVNDEGILSPPAGIRPVCKNMSPQFDSILYYFDIYRWKKICAGETLTKILGNYFNERTTWSLCTKFFFHPWASPKKIMMRDGGDISLHTGAIPAGRLSQATGAITIGTANSVL